MVFVLIRSGLFVIINPIKMMCASERLDISERAERNAWYPYDSLVSRFIHIKTSVVGKRLTKSSNRSLIF